jgi:hypothetical protein
MPHRFAGEDDWEEADGWADDEQESDASSDDDEPTAPCPHCKKEIHEDAEWCPNCEQYISAEDTPAQSRPWWIILGVLLCFWAVYQWIVN